MSGLEVNQTNAPVSREGQWTPLEVGIWISTLIITITLGGLVVTDSVGTWAVVVPGAMGVIAALWRYRVEAVRKKQSPEDRSE